MADDPQKPPPRAEPPGNANDAATNAADDDANGADANDADASGADPSGADPSGADPSDADPSGADPSGADASGADPSGAAVEDDLASVGDRDAVFEALWKRVEGAWDDDKPHAALLEHAIKSEKLPDLAGRYRALQEDPDKGARAKKKIDGIVIAATHMLMATKTPTRTKTPWQWSAAAALTFAVVCAWLFYQLFVPHR